MRRRAATGLLRSNLLRVGLLGVSLLGAGPAPAATAADAPTDAYPGAAASYLVVVNGLELWARAPDEPRPPASLSKLLTALLVVGDFDATAMVAVSAAAAQATGARLGLRAGETLRAGDALTAMLLGSGNDVCLALAEHVAGTAAAFVDRMNERASQLGMTRSHFRNPCGLDAPGQVATARDLWRLTAAALAEPEIARRVVLAQARITTAGGRRFELSNGNLLIGRHPGVVGAKTGFTSRAGKCLAAVARRDGDEVAVILLNSPERWWAAPILLEDAFAALHASRQ